MKKIFYLLAITILSSTISVNAQDDKILFQKAMDDAKTIEQNEVEALQIISTKTSVVTLTESDCTDFQNNEKYFSNKDFWVTQSDEMKSVFQSKKGEFANKENRLKKLLGLRYDKTYKCLVELEVDVCKLTRPSSLIDIQGTLLKLINSPIFD